LYDCGNLECSEADWNAYRQSKKGKIGELGDYHGELADRYRRAEDRWWDIVPPEPPPPYRFSISELESDALAFRRWSEECLADGELQKRISDACRKALARIRKRSGAAAE
jgi:hypothetical protein